MYYVFHKLLIIGEVDSFDVGIWNKYRSAFENDNSFKEKAAQVISFSFRRIKF